jgi:hypothetical protein
MNPYTMFTLFLTNVSKAFDGEKTASTANVAGKSSYLLAEN